MSVSLSSTVNPIQSPFQFLSPEMKIAVLEQLKEIALVAILQVNKEFHAYGADRNFQKKIMLFRAKKCALGAQVIFLRIAKIQGINGDACGIEHTMAEIHDEFWRKRAILYQIMAFVKGRRLQEALDLAHGISGMDEGLSIY